MESYIFFFLIQSKLIIAYKRETKMKRENIKFKKYFQSEFLRENLWKIKKKEKYE